MWWLMACTSSEPVPPDRRPEVELENDTAEPATDTAEQEIDTADSGNAPPMVDALCVNEFMADNESVLFDDDGGTPDWLELHNPTDATVSLAGWSITDDEAEPQLHVLSDSLDLTPGEFLLLYADDDVDAGSTHLGLKLSSDGGVVGLFAPDGSGQLIRYGSVEEDFSIAKQDDCCSGDCLTFDFRGTPGTTNNPPTPVALEVFSLGSNWRYLDTDAAPEADWTAADFDDSTWSEGPGPLGFGDTHQVTIVQSGGDNDRTPTVYFRTTFTLAHEAVGLQLDLMRDDGALVWLNGQELLRSNLPDGDINHETLATTAIGSPNEDAVGTYTADPTLLTSGLNVLAVEVHQASATSSDLTFDLAVEVEVLK
jgi:hypothetical protein